jgi:hypothetical protein
MERHCEKDLNELKERLLWTSSLLVGAQHAAPLLGKTVAARAVFALLLGRT